MIGSIKSTSARLAPPGVWVALAILLAMGVAAFRTTTVLIENTAWVEHTHEVIERLGEQRAALSEAVAARRAHGLTGDALTLVTYADAIGRLQAAGAAVRRLTTDNLSQQRRLDELEPLIQERIAGLGGVIEKKQHGADSPAIETQATRAGETADLRIFAAISAMVDEELRLLAVRRQRTTRGVASVRLVQIAALCASFAILIIAFRRLRQDLLRRLQLERLARESEESLATILMSIGDGVISTDAEGRVTRVNRVAAALTGWTDEAASGKPLPEVFRIVNAETRATAPDPVEQALRLGVTVALASDTVLLRQDGSELPIADSCAPVSGPDGKVRGAVLVFRDVSQEQQARKVKEAAQRQIIVSERMASIGTLAAGVAHEINNPLAYVTANLDMILEELKLLAGAPGSGRSQELEEMAIEARQGAERVRKIVRGLKTFSRAEEERRSVVDVRSVAELSINMAFNEIRHRARLVKDFGKIPLVDADEARLGQVFINLLVNAAQAIPEGDTEGNEIRISTSTDAQGRAVAEVRDTGPGIPEAVIGRIFDPFFTTKPIGVGTGLGLSICHNLVTGMGGELTVASRKGQGTTFRVVLPAATAGLPAAGAAPVVPQDRPDAAAVLIVDDDLRVGNSLGRVLRGHDVTVVGSARSALELLASGKRFDVILSDLMMPGMSGMDLHEELVRKFPEAAGRVVFVTGGAFTPGADAFLDRVANERIEKPFDPKRVRALVRRLVHRPA